MKRGVDISYEQMRSAVIHVLAQPRTDPWALSTFWDSVAAAVSERHSIKPDPEGQSGIIHMIHHDFITLTDPDRARATSIIWDLIIEGVVRPGSDKGSDQWPYFHVTEFGKERIKDPRTPYDPDGYLTAVKSELPGVDQVILAYLTESLQTFRIGCLLSSIITLGCASEKALLC